MEGAKSQKRILEMDEIQIDGAQERVVLSDFEKHVLCKVSERTARHLR